MPHAVPAERGWGVYSASPLSQSPSRLAFPRAGGWPCWGVQGASVLSGEFCVCCWLVCSGEAALVLLGRVCPWLGRRQMAGQRPRHMPEAGFGPGLLVTAEQLKAPEELERTVVPQDGHG